MTPHVLGLLLLKYNGVTSYDPATNANNLNQPTLGATDVQDVVTYINAALQEIVHRAPAAWFTQRTGFALRAPATLTGSMTQYSTAFNGMGTWDASMIGCSVLISGDDAYNRIVSSVELERPYMGSTGSGKTATVYFDAVALNANILQVIEPVQVADERTLLPAPDSLTYARLVNEGMGYDHSAPLDLVHGMHSHGHRVTGEPLIWTAERNYSGSSGYTTTYQGGKVLRVYPMPERAYPLFARVKWALPAITAADLYSGTAYTTDPWTAANKTLPVDDAVLVGVAAQHWTAHPAFSNNAAKTSIAQQYKIALDLLAGNGPVSVGFNRFTGAA